MATMEMPFEMKSLTSFPMEKLCFDLKLEVLEQMQPRDVFELAKGNKGFQRMLVGDPSIVFGEHVSKIELRDEMIWIKKFSDSDAMKLNVDGFFLHFSFAKKIRSCNDLGVIKTSKNAPYKLLNNLKSVNQLWLRQFLEEPLEKFFSNFHASIKKEASLRIIFVELPPLPPTSINTGLHYTIPFFPIRFKDQAIKDLIENFIVARLKGCEKITITFYSNFEDSFRFYCNALLKTQVKNVSLVVWCRGYIDFFARQIITNGIPTKNPEAAIDIYSREFPPPTMDLSQYPGMRRIDGENRLRLVKQANQFAGTRPTWNSRESRGFEATGNIFDMESSMFRRRIDSTKDCIYMYQNHAVDDHDNGEKDCYFLAFYVPVK